MTRSGSRLRHQSGSGCILSFSYGLPDAVASSRSTIACGLPSSGSRSAAWRLLWPCLSPLALSYASAKPSAHCASWRRLASLAPWAHPFTAVLLHSFSVAAGCTSLGAGAALRRLRWPIGAVQMPVRAEEGVLRVRPALWFVPPSPRAGHQPIPPLDGGGFILSLEAGYPIRCRGL